MERITQEILEKRVQYLNSIVGISKPTYNTIGSYQTDYSYGAVSIIKITSNSGACDTIIYKGTKRETFISLCSFINGYVQKIEDTNKTD